MSLPSTHDPRATVPAVVGCGDVPFSSLRNNVLGFSALGLHCRVQACTSCSGGRPLELRCAGFSLGVGLWAPRLQRPQRGFRRLGLQAPKGTACRSCDTRAPVPSWPGLFPDQRWSPCPRVGRQSLVHCSTREVPFLPFVFWPQTRIERSSSMGSAGS